MNLRLLTLFGHVVEAQPPAPHHKKVPAAGTVFFCSPYIHHQPLQTSINFLSTVTIQDLSDSPVEGVHWLGGTGGSTRGLGFVNQAAL